MTVSKHLASCILLLLFQPLHAIPDPLERYILTKCQGGRIPAQKGEDSLIGSLMPSRPKDLSCGANGTQLIQGRSNRTFYMQSNHTLSEFQKHFTAMGRFSVTIWMTPAESLFNRVFPILTFGGMERSPSSIAKECPGFDFRVSQTSSTLFVSFTDHQGTCQHWYTERIILEQGKPTHVAIAFGENDSQLFVDGVPVYRKGTLNMTIDIRNWNNTSTKALQLFTNRRDTDEFLGSIGQIELYDETLSAKSVDALFVLGGVYPKPPHQNSTVSNTPNAAPLPPRTKSSASPTVPPSQLLAPSTTPSEVPSMSPYKQPTEDLWLPTASPRLREATKRPSFAQSTSSPTEKISNEEMRLEWPIVIAFGVFGMAVVCFCVWSICGGWPRFVAHRGKKVEIIHYDDKF
jgi:Concanavalin A-like lectin/glucanases superfamily